MSRNPRLTPTSYIVLGLLEHGEVLEPPPVRAEVIAWLEGLAGISS